MKISLEQKERGSNPFPHLAQSRTIEGLVVLFTSAASGICISKGATMLIEGSFRQNWSSDSDRWIILPKGTKVTFEQE